MLPCSLSFLPLLQPQQYMRNYIFPINVVFIHVTIYDLKYFFSSCMGKFFPIIVPKIYLTNTSYIDRPATSVLSSWTANISKAFNLYTNSFSICCLNIVMLQPSLLRLLRVCSWLSNMHGLMKFSAIVCGLPYPII